MRAPEIIASIPWPDDFDDAQRLVIEDAIRALDAKAFGNSRPTLNAAQPFLRLRAYVEKAGSANAAAAQLGISKGFLSQIRNSTRPIPDGVLAQLGLCRAPRGREVYLEL